MFIYASFIINAFLLIAINFLFFKLNNRKNEVLALKNQLLEAQSLNKLLDGQKLELKDSLDEERYINAKIDKELEILKQSNSELKEVVSNQSKIEKENVELKEKMKHYEEKMQLWEKSQEESIKQAKATIFSVGHELSSKLLEEHRKNAKELQEQSETSFKSTSENLFHKFTDVVNSVTTLKSQVDEAKMNVETIKNALLTPGGAGNLSEITLENLLKNSGLIQNQDFIMQYNFNNGEANLRPDAVIFLPNNSVLVIDSKASKHFMEIQDEPEEKLVQKLKSSMRNHLKSLNNKNYHLELQKYFNDKSDFKINYISQIMFVASDLALAKLQMLDPDFITQAWQANIFPASPSSLAHILSIANYQIINNKQQENFKHIILEIEKLLSSINIMTEHADKVGSHIKNAANSYDKFAASFNHNFLSKVNKINKLGLVEQRTSDTKNVKLNRLFIGDIDAGKLIEEGDV